MGLLAELQRSEIFDLTRLMHLPVSLRDVFLLNYIASHFSLSLAMMLPAMLGLAAGMLLGRGPAMLLLFPLVLGFFFMVTAWTYCLRGWLAALMVNKRRRRAIIVGVTMGFVLLSQLPNLIFNVFSARHARPSQTAQGNANPGEPEAIAKERLISTLDLSNRYVPLLWLPQGARALAEGNALQTIGCAFGMVAIGAWGLARTYRATLRFYRGGETGKPVRAVSAVREVRPGERFLVQRTLPYVPEQAAALALAGFRSFTRAPEVKMGLATNVLIFAVMGAGLLLRRGGALPQAAGPFAAAGAVAVTFVGLTQLMFNQFGFDRAGFRTLVLAPAPRRLVLLGKNLALLPIALAVFVIYLTLITVLARLGVLEILSAVLEAGGAFLLLSAIGNFVSIISPYRVPAGSMRPAKTKGVTQLLVFVTHMLFPLALAPVFIPAGLGLLSSRLGWLPGEVVTPLCALLMAAACATLYWQTLEPLGNLLQQREQRILEAVTQEVE